MRLKSKQAQEPSSSYAHQIQSYWKQHNEPSFVLLNWEHNQGRI